MKDCYTILVVDDSPSIRQAIKRYVLTACNAEFVEASNGEEAEKILQECLLVGAPVDIIILDWMMPKMSGFEFLKKIRSTEVFRNSPNVVMVTAETFSEQINTCLMYGVAAYVTKPFTPEDIAGAIKKAIEREELAHAV